MNVRLITQDEISDHQQFVRTGYLRTQQGFSISGIRRLMGNSVIAMGQKIHGRERRESLASELDDCLHGRERRESLVAPVVPARGVAS